MKDSAHSEEDAAAGSADRAKTAALAELLRRELEHLGAAPPPETTAPRGSSGSLPPRPTRPLFGLALSGGGIRSATFNLGVLIGLKRLGLLGRLDYLSMVSGGGYIGSWWASWRARHAGAEFPVAGPTEAESSSIRRLREHSNFLAPRQLGSTDQRRLVVEFLAAAAASLSLFLLLAAAALTAVALLSVGLSDSLGIVRGAIGGFAVLTGVWWLGGEGRRTRALPRFLLALATAAAAGALLGLRSPGSAEAGVAVCADAGAWAVHLIPLGAAAAALLVLRLCVLASRWRPPAAVRSPFAGDVEFTLGGLLVTAAVYSAGCGAWTTAHWLDESFGDLVTALGGTAGAGVLSVIAALLARRKGSKSNWSETGGAVSALGRMSPPLAAWAGAFGLVVGAAHLLSLVDATPSNLQRTWILAGSVVGMAALLPLLVPEEVGLHRSYRERIRHTFLMSGKEAASAEPPDRKIDDQALRQLVPIHLVCCAANDLDGDYLSNLGRGARSATLSAFGFQVDLAAKGWTGEEAPPLSSAITASAAAFNPNQGEASVKMGPAVSLLLAVLNLRLGLWLPHPYAKRGTTAPALAGCMILREAFRLTRTDNADGWVHLSDGGHFENTALYELIRRRCRYVIVSDCGQDEKLEFEDLGNAIRRIRTDHGVEIDVDLSPLRADDSGVSRQHVVVGEIRYGPAERGTLIIVKPTITGDEPGDVLQYRSRNRAFPHESTRDQFYDHAQWEAYRRLGEHEILTAFQSMIGTIDPAWIEEVFRRARLEWFPTPPEFESSFLELTQRCHEIEHQLRDSAPFWLMRQVYSELDAVAPPTAPADVTAEEWGATVQVLIQMIQLIEDVLVGCRLDEYWDHPLNQGWINYFQRWARAPALRRWWPVLRPVWSPETRRFLDERFDLAGVSNLDDPEVASARLLASKPPEGLAYAHFVKAEGEGAFARFGESGRWIEFVLRDSPAELQIALLAAQVGEDEDGVSTATWHISDLFVLPWLRGTGVEAAFVGRIVEVAQRNGIERLVCIPGQGGLSGDAVPVWRDRVDTTLLQLYYAVGFHPDAVGRLVRRVPPDGDST